MEYSEAHFASVSSFVDTNLSVTTETDLTQPEAFQESSISKARSKCLKMLYH